MPRLQKFSERAPLQRLPHPANSYCAWKPSGRTVLAKFSAKPRTGVEACGARQREKRQPRQGVPEASTPLTGAGFDYPEYDVCRPKSHALVKNFCLVSGLGGRGAPRTGSPTGGSGSEAGPRWPQQRGSKAKRPRRTMRRLLPGGGPGSEAGPRWPASRKVSRYAWPPGKFRRAW